MTYLVDGGKLVEVNAVSPRDAALLYLCIDPSPPAGRIEVHLVAAEEIWRFDVGRQPDRRAA